jgi:hypothetical protein
MNSNREVETASLSQGANKMKKSVISVLAVAAAFAMIASPAIAQNNGLLFYMDTRSTGAAIDGAPMAPWSNGVTGGGPGSGSVLYIQPQFPGGQQAGTDVGALYLYAKVSDRAVGVDEAVAAVGLDFKVARTNQTPGANANNIESLGFTWFSTAGDVGGGLVGDAFDGTTAPTAGVAGDANNWSVDANKAVAVPVTAAPAFDTAKGLVPGGSYRLGRLDVNAAITPVAAYPPAADSVFGVKMEVNNLLVARVYNPDQGVGPTPELPDFGFVGALPEQANVNGASGDDEGLTSATDDATISIRRKSDYNGDGLVNNIDFGGFLSAKGASLAGTQSVLQVHLGDYNGDRLVNNIDFGGFLSSKGIP